MEELTFEEKVNAIKQDKKKTFKVTPYEITHYFGYQRRSWGLVEHVNSFLDKNNVCLNRDFYNAYFYEGLLLQNKPKKPSLVQINSNTRIIGTKYIREHEFKTGHNVSIFEAETYHGLTQLLGKAKFVNKEYGMVMYRGECSLHDNVIPSVFRGRSNVANAVANINTIKNRIIKDVKLSNFIKLSKDPKDSNDQLEGLLQHYGVKTRYIDVVDNHWVAIWMGLHECMEYKLNEKYYRYQKREIPIVDLLDNVISDVVQDIKTEDKYYQYVLLLALPNPSEHKNGIGIHNSYKIIDLRQAVPSTFLRPHAQHGIVVRKTGRGCDKVEDYDFSKDVVCIIRIRIDRAAAWLGDGQLMTQDSLFPAPAFDNGYSILLERKDIFENTTSQIYHYI